MPTARRGEDPLVLRPVGRHVGGEVRFDGEVLLLQPGHALQLLGIDVLGFREAGLEVFEGAERVPPRDGGLLVLPFVAAPVLHETTSAFERADHLDVLVVAAQRTHDQRHGYPVPTVLAPTASRCACPSKGRILAFGKGGREWGHSGRPGAGTSCPSDPPVPGYGSSWSSAPHGSLGSAPFFPRTPIRAGCSSLSLREQRIARSQHPDHHAHRSSAEGGTRPFGHATHIRCTHSSYFGSTSSVRWLVPASAVTPDDVVRHVFRYLAEVGESRTKPVRTHDDARHQVWFADLPAQFGSFLTDDVPGDTPLWLRADRPVRHEPPAPPQPLAHWLADREIHDSARETPRAAGRDGHSGGRDLRRGKRTHPAHHRVPGRLAPA